MLGVIGVILGIVALVFLAWHRWNAVICAVVATLIIGVFNGFGVWGVFTDYWLPAAGGWVTKWLLLFLSAGVYAKVVGDSGACDRIASFIVEKAPKRAIYPILIAICSLLTFGGINALVIVFVFWPLAMPIAKAMNKPRYIFLTIMYCGLLGGFNWAMPGSPQATNVSAASLFETTPFAAPVYGVAVTLVTLAFQCWFVFFLDKWAVRHGDVFEEGVGMDLKSRPVETCPSLGRSVVPFVVLLALFFVLGNGIGVAKMDPVQAVTYANIIASVVCIVINHGYYKAEGQGTSVLQGIKRSLFDGVNAGVSPAITMLSMVAFASVFAATDTFRYITDAAINSCDNVYLQAFISTQLLGFLVGSASGTVASVGNTFAATWLATPGLNNAALARIVSIGSAGLSTVPFSGGLFVNLDVSGCKMKHVWPQQFVACAVPSILFALIGVALANAGLML